MPPPPATDLQPQASAAASAAAAAAAPLASLGRSLFSLRRDQVPHPEAHSGELEAEAFQRHVAEVFLELNLDNGEDLLSLAWLRRSLDSFLLCLEEFRAVLFGRGASTLSRTPVDRLVADFFERAVKALDLCNAVRDGIDHIRHWRRHLSVVAAALDAGGGDAPLGEGQIRRARKALGDLAVLMLDDKESATGHRNRSIGRGHHQRSGSGGSSGSGSGDHFRSLSWSVSRTWSAQRQLNAIASGLAAPRAHDITASFGVANVVYTMGAVLFIVAWGLVAAIPCQDRGLQAHFAAPRNYAWASSLNSLYEKILEEGKKKERKNSFGLLKEIYRIEVCTRQLMEVTDTAEFPLPPEKEAEARELGKEIADICSALNEGVDPLEKQLREVFRRIVRSQSEILDCVNHGHHIAE